MSSAAWHQPHPGDPVPPSVSQWSLKSPYTRVSLISLSTTQCEEKVRPYAGEPRRFCIPPLRGSYCVLSNSQICTARGLLHGHAPIFFRSSRSRPS